MGYPHRGALDPAYVAGPARPRGRGVPRGRIRAGAAGGHVVETDTREEDWRAGEYGIMPLVDGPPVVRAVGGPSSGSSPGRGGASRGKTPLQRAQDNYLAAAASGRGRTPSSPGGRGRGGAGFPGNMRTERSQMTTGEPIASTSRQPYRASGSGLAEEPRSTGSRGRGGSSSGIRGGTTYPVQSSRVNEEEVRRERPYFQDNSNTPERSQGHTYFAGRDDGIGSSGAGADWTNDRDTREGVPERRPIKPIPAGPRMDWDTSSHASDSLNRYRPPGNPLYPRRDDPPHPPSAPRTPQLNAPRGVTGAYTPTPASGSKAIIKPSGSSTTPAHTRFDKPVTSNFARPSYDQPPPAKRQRTDIKLDTQQRRINGTGVTPMIVDKSAQAAAPSDAGADDFGSDHDMEIDSDRYSPSAPRTAGIRAATPPSPIPSPVALRPEGQAAIVRAAKERLERSVSSNTIRPIRPVLELPRIQQNPHRDPVHERKRTEQHPPRDHTPEQTWIQQDAHPVQNQEAPKIQQDIQRDTVMGRPGFQQEPQQDHARGRPRGRRDSQQGEALAKIVSDKEQGILESKEEIDELEEEDGKGIDEPVTITLDGEDDAYEAGEVSSEQLSGSAIVYMPQDCRKSNLIPWRTNRAQLVKTQTRMLNNQCRQVERTLWRDDGLAVDWRLDKNRGTYTVTWPFGLKGKSEKEAWGKQEAQRFCALDPGRVIVKQFPGVNSLKVEWIRNSHNIAQEDALPAEPEADPIPPLATPPIADGASAFRKELIQRQEEPKAAKPVRNDGAEATRRGRALSASEASSRSASNIASEPSMTSDATASNATSKRKVAQPQPARSEISDTPPLVRKAKRRRRSDSQDDGSVDPSGLPPPHRSAIPLAPLSPDRGILQRNIDDINVDLVHLMQDVEPWMKSHPDEVSATPVLVHGLTRMEVLYFATWYNSRWTYNRADLPRTAWSSIGTGPYSCIRFRRASLSNPSASCVNADTAPVPFDQREVSFGTPDGQIITKQALQSLSDMDGECFANSRLDAFDVSSGATGRLLMIGWLGRVRFISHGFAVPCRRTLLFRPRQAPDPTCAPFEILGDILTLASTGRDSSILDFRPAKPVGRVYRYQARESVATVSVAPADVSGGVAMRKTNPTVARRDSATQSSGLSDRQSGGALSAGSEEVPNQVTLVTSNNASNTTDPVPKLRLRMAQLTKDIIRWKVLLRESISDDDKAYYKDEIARLRDELLEISDELEKAKKDESGQSAPRPSAAASLAVGPVVSEAISISSNTDEEGASQSSNTSSASSSEEEEEEVEEEGGREEDMEADVEQEDVSSDDSSSHQPTPTEPDRGVRGTVASLRERKHISAKRTPLERLRFVDVAPGNGTPVVFSSKGALTAYDKTFKSDVLRTTVNLPTGFLAVDGACVSTEIFAVTQSHDFAPKLPLLMYRFYHDGLRRREPKILTLDATPHLGTVSAVTAISHTERTARFATGGQDKAIFLWDIVAKFPSDKLEITRPPVKLYDSHSSRISSLVYSSAQKWLLSTADDCRIKVYDCASQSLAASREFRVDVPLTHLHVNASSPYLIATERKHTREQFTVYDLRTRGRALRVFGYDQASTVSNLNASTRFVKGSFSGVLFARGDKDGAVRIWDLRQDGQPMRTIPQHQGPLAHTLLKDDKLYCLSQDSLLEQTVGWKTLGE